MLISIMFDFAAITSGMTSIFGGSLQSLRKCLNLPINLQCSSLRNSAVLIDRYKVSYINFSGTFKPAANNNKENS